MSRFVVFMAFLWLSFAADDCLGGGAFVLGMNSECNLMDWRTCTGGEDCSQKACTVAGNLMVRWIDITPSPTPNKTQELASWDCFGAGGSVVALDAACRPTGATYSCRNAEHCRSLLCMLWERDPAFVSVRPNK